MIPPAEPEIPALDPASRRLPFRILSHDFFDRDAQVVAIDLLGKVLCHHVDDGTFYSARIIEVEAYHRWDKGSHASLGWSPSRAPLFQPPGTIYMYYARGGDSFNISVKGDGDAVLIKSAYPFCLQGDPQAMVKAMIRNNPVRGKNPRPRRIEKLCSGQTLLCRSMRIRVPDWSGKALATSSSDKKNKIFIADAFFPIPLMIQTSRLGIAAHRDPHRLLRYIDAEYEKYCTAPVSTKRKLRQGKDWFYVTPETFLRESPEETP